MEAIVAVFSDWGIGSEGTQQVVLKADRAHFRELTKGAAVIVGRRTLADFPEPVGSVVNEWVRPNGLQIRQIRVPIGVVQILLWAIVLLAGWLLGGAVGIGTLISTFCAGLVMQLVYALLRFEPRDVRHRGVAEVVRQLLRK